MAEQRFYLPQTLIDGLEEVADNDNERPSQADRQSLRSSLDTYLKNYEEASKNVFCKGAQKVITGVFRVIKLCQAGRMPTFTEVRKALDDVVDVSAIAISVLTGGKYGAVASVVALIVNIGVKLVSKFFDVTPEELLTHKMDSLADFVAQVNDILTDIENDVIIGEIREVKSAYFLCLSYFQYYGSKHNKDLEFDEVTKARINGIPLRIHVDTLGRLDSKLRRYFKARHESSVSHEKITSYIHLYVGITRQRRSLLVQLQLLYLRKDYSIVNNIMIDRMVKREKAASKKLFEPFFVDDNVLASVDKKKILRHRNVFGLLAAVYKTGPFELATIEEVSECEFAGKLVNIYVKKKIKNMNETTKFYMKAFDDAKVRPRPKDEHPGIKEDDGAFAFVKYEKDMNCLLLSCKYKQVLLRKREGDVKVFLTSKDGDSVIWTLEPGSSSGSFTIEASSNGYVVANGETQLLVTSSTKYPRDWYFAALRHKLQPLHE